jgi:hypothetical protein
MLICFSQTISSPKARTRMYKAYMYHYFVRAMCPTHLILNSIVYP